ncbi:hypothetical protein PR048_027359 [Dryococelus australis]|uniref:Uncharacterized protein n=1 Tax=Dryococelus australis TaxID=614101 RepID=A0ABQ9GF88_9NEOP|nr:hypothetical protein PR048_027359 [Dryococelus australis]
MDSGCRATRRLACVTVPLPCWRFRRVWRRHKNVLVRLAGASALRDVSRELAKILAWSSAGMKGRGNGRSPRKPANQRHRPPRFPHAKIREQPCRESNPFRLGGRRVVKPLHHPDPQDQYNFTDSNWFNPIGYTDPLLFTAPVISSVHVQRARSGWHGNRTEALKTWLAGKQNKAADTRDYVAVRPRSRREGAIRATLTRTPSASSLLRARRAVFPSSHFRDFVPSQLMWVRIPASLQRAITCTMKAPTRTGQSQRPSLSRMTSARAATCVMFGEASPGVRDDVRPATLRHPVLRGPPREACRPTGARRRPNTHRRHVIHPQTEKVAPGEVTVSSPRGRAREVKEDLTTAKLQPRLRRCDPVCHDRTCPRLALEGVIPVLCEYNCFPPRSRPKRHSRGTPRTQLDVLQPSLFLVGASLSSSRPTWTDSRAKGSSSRYAHARKDLEVDDVCKRSPTTRRARRVFPGERLFVVQYDAPLPPTTRSDALAVVSSDVDAQPLTANPPPPTIPPASSDVPVDPTIRRHLRALSPATRLRFNSPSARSVPGMRLAQGELGVGGQRLMEVIVGVAAPSCRLVRVLPSGSQGLPTHLSPSDVSFLSSSLYALGTPALCGSGIEKQFFSMAQSTAESESLRDRGEKGASQPESVQNSWVEGGGFANRLMLRGEWLEGDASPKTRGGGSRQGGAICPLLTDKRHVSLTPNLTLDTCLHRSLLFTRHSVLAGFHATIEGAASQQASPLPYWFANGIDDNVSTPAGINDNVSTPAGINDCTNKGEVGRRFVCIVLHDYHMRKSEVTRTGIELGSPWWEASSLTAQPPRLIHSRVMVYNLLASDSQQH